MALSDDALSALRAELIEHGAVYVEKSNRAQVRDYLHRVQEQFSISWETDNLLKFEQVKPSP